MANISEVPPDPEMESENAEESHADTSKKLDDLLDDDAIWVNFGVGGPA